MGFNGKCLKTAVFSACEVERSETEQVEKTAGFQAYVKALSFFILISIQQLSFISDTINLIFGILI